MTQVLFCDGNARSNFYGQRVDGDAVRVRQSLQERIGLEILFQFKIQKGSRVAHHPGITDQAVGAVGVCHLQIWQLLFPELFIAKCNGAELRMKEAQQSNGDQISMHPLVENAGPSA